jgi:hypothetical protein
MGAGHRASGLADSGGELKHHRLAHAPDQDVLPLPFLTEV